MRGSWRFAPLFETSIAILGHSQFLCIFVSALSAQRIKSHLLKEGQQHTSLRRCNFLHQHLDMFTASFSHLAVLLCASVALAVPQATPTRMLDALHGCLCSLSVIAPGIPLEYTVAYQEWNELPDPALCSGSPASSGSFSIGHCTDLLVANIKLTPEYLPAQGGLHALHRLQSGCQSITF
jgi:hypothetical protein